MARYQQRIFDAFGPTAIGQAAAAVVIGALMGFFLGRKFAPGDRFVIGTFAAGAAGAGLIGATILILRDSRRKKVAAGTAKPLSTTFWIVASIVGAVILFMGFAAYVLL